MPTYLSLSLGVGDFFRFNFEYGQRRESSPSTLDHKSAVTDLEMAKVC